MSLETIQKISISIASILAIIGMIVLYFKIWRISSKMKNINNEIEKQENLLNNKEIESIKSDYDFGLNLGDNSKEKKEKRAIEQKIEKLNREKIYLSEEISLYKIFKK